MSKILSRFRRSPSRSSTASQDDETLQREATASSQLFTEGASPLSHTHRIPSGSVFVEDIPETTTSPRRIASLPSPLAIPPPSLKPSIGTPKLVLTEEGSSPRSFSYSPQLTSPSKKGLESASHLTNPLILAPPQRSSHVRRSAGRPSPFPIQPLE